MLNFIYNAKSGNGKGKRAMKAVSKHLDAIGVAYRKFITTYEKHAIDIAKTLSAEGERDIIAVGGDGTINEILNGINLETVNFGIIPAGTGNDFAFSCNIPLKPLKALAIILTQVPRPTDYMDCSGVRGINVIGTGIDVDILKRCKKQQLIKGKLKYIFSLIISLFKFKSYEFDIIKDKTKHSKEALIVCVGNGKRFGGGIKICPNAEIDDGLMDFIVCNKVRKRNIPLAFIKLMKGKILEQPFTEFSRQSEVSISFIKPTTINIDGELYENLPFEVKLIKGGVNIYMPKK